MSTGAVIYVIRVHAFVMHCDSNTLPGLTVIVRVETSTQHIIQVQSLSHHYAQDHCEGH